MSSGDGDRSPSSAGQTADAAELAALDAEIARLSRRRDELRARIASASVAQTPASGTSSIGSTSSGASTSATSLAKADWYPDPFGRFAWRYWDGSEWTAAAARDGVTYQDPPVWRTSTATTSTTTSSETERKSTGPAALQTTSSTSASTDGFPPPGTGSATRSTPTIPGSAAGPSSAGSDSQPAWWAPNQQPVHARPDIDVGKLILIVGAALLIGGVAGLSVWLWNQLPVLGRLGLLGLASALQIGIAVRIRERLQTAAEAFAATGAATLLFAVGSVGFSATWDGTAGVAVGVVGVGLLLSARFRAWVITGHLAIVVGAIAVLVAEPWSQTALILAVVLGVVRWFGVKATESFRPENFPVYPELLTASGLLALLAAAVLAEFQFGTVATAGVLVVVAVALSEILVRARTSPYERELSLAAGAVAAIGEVGWSAVLWESGSRSDGLVALSVTAVVALLLWRAGRTETALRPSLTAVAIGLVPVAARFAFDSASDSELIVFCAVASVAGLAAGMFLGKRTILDKPLPVWFWTGAVIASLGGTSQLAWPRLVLATIAFASLAQIMKLDVLRYAAAATATLTLADLLYGGTFEVTWWFRPDVLGAGAAVFLFVANRTRSTPWSLKAGNWDVPRYLESAVALMVVPVADLVAQPAYADLPSESLWRMGFVGVLLVGSWGYGVVRRTRPNALQVVTLVALGAVIVSRVADESAATRTGAWALIGALATIAFSVLASVRKIDELRYLAAASATMTVAVLLYGDLFEVTWWYRPDVIAVTAAVSLFIANRTQTTPWTASMGTWVVPRYVESAIALMVVPVADLVAQPAFADLPSESTWRLGFIAVLLVGSWAYGALRRGRPDALQVATLAAASIVVVSRLADESPTVRSGAWVLVGSLATIGFSVLASVRKVDEPRYLAAASATMTVAVLLYGDLFELTWWFRPDIVGAAAAVSLFIANRTRTTQWSVKAGNWEVPRYWEAAAALLVVPVADLASKPAFADLPSESVWRMGFVGVLLVGSWGYGAVRRVRPNALQAMTLVAAGVVIVSRVADESLEVRSGAWVIIGFAFVVAALKFRRVELLVPAAGSWMLVVFMYSPPGPLEVLTCSLAAIAGVVATIARRFGRTGTLDFIPATALALVPSAFAAARAVLDADVDSEQVTRIAVVLVVGAIALAVGTYRRMAALVGPAVVALVALAVAQLIVVQRNTSGWVSALVAGVVLLAVGTRLEYLRSVSRRAGDLVRSLR